MMTKTNDKYTFDDFLLRKRVLKQEIRDIEETFTMENIPKTLGFIKTGVKNKAFELVSNPAALISLAMDIGMGVGAEKVVSLFVNKKTIKGKAIALASGYLVPFAVEKTKGLLSKLKSKKNNRTDNNTDNNTIFLDENNNL